MPANPTPERVLQAFYQERDLVSSGAASADATLKPGGAFYNWAYDDFLAALPELNDEVEARAYLVMIASVEATLQLDVRERAKGKNSMVLASTAKRLVAGEDSHRPRRVDVENILDAWRDEGLGKKLVGEFKQLLDHRHWLAHGRYWSNHSGIATTTLTPEFAFARWKKVLEAIRTIDAAFPLG